MSYIKIKTTIPHEEDLKLIEELKQYEALSMHGQLPIVWDWAHDFIVGDRWGNEFIDFTSGICVANSGHSNSKVCDAMVYQRYDFLLHSYTFPTVVRRDYLKELCRVTGFEKAFLVSAGTEATEVACKLMRMYGLSKETEYNKQEYYTKKNVILSFKGAMHGRTLVAEQLKGYNKDNIWADAFTDERIMHLEFPQDNDRFESSIEHLAIIEEEICGIIIETYQGWSASFYPMQYIQDLVRWAKERDIIVCFDEIQGGFGRTGKLFNYEHYNLPYKPDLVCIGKGMTSSLPMSGVLGRKDLLDLPPIGSMSSTHSANPLCCAVGLANLKEIERILPTVDEKGYILFELLGKNLLTYRINCRGLLAGIITPTTDFATKVCYKAIKKGLLLIHTNKPSIKIAPPLTITEEGIREGVNVLLESIKEVENGL